MNSDSKLIRNKFDRLLSREGIEVYFNPLALTDQLLDAYLGETRDLVEQSYFRNSMYVKQAAYERILGTIVPRPKYTGFENFASEYVSCKQMLIEAGAADVGDQDPIIESTSTTTSVEAGTYRAELVKVVGKISNRLLLLSGGLDSELLATVMLHGGILFTPVICRWVNDSGECYNAYDTDYAFEFCTKHHLVPKVYTINVVQLWKSSAFIHRTAELGFTSPHIGTYAHTVDVLCAEYANCSVLFGGEVRYTLSEDLTKISFVAKWVPKPDRIVSNDSATWVAPTADYQSFGWSVAVYGDTLVVGAPYAYIKAATKGGAAYVFSRSGDTWTQQQILQPNDPNPSWQFGHTVAINGDTIAVHSYYVSTTMNSGSVYVFRKGSSGWNQEQKIANPLGSTRFGYTAVALDGDRLCVGFAEAKRVYAYVRTGNVWNNEIAGVNNFIAAIDTANAGYFGCNVALNGSTMIIGAHSATTSSTSSGIAASTGAAYVFVKTPTSGWMQKAILEPNINGAGDGDFSAYFGWSVAYDGTYVAVGSPRLTTSGASAGAVYTYTVTNGNVDTNGFRLVGSNTSANDQFGYSVSIHNRVLTVGSPYDTIDSVSPAASSGGSAYIYKRMLAGSWAEQAFVQSVDKSESSDNFGYSVSVHSNNVIIGCPRGDGRISTAGASKNAGCAYYFAPPA